MKYNPIVQAQWAIEYSRNLNIDKMSTYSYQNEKFCYLIMI